jgi:hypothetical protein
MATGMVSVEKRKAARCTVSATWRQPVPVYQRSAIAAQCVPIREAGCIDLAGYIANQPAGQQYQAYWTQGEVQQADTQVKKP